MKKALIIANGKPPKKQEIKYLQSIGYRYIVCADGGANSAKRLNITPDIIVGDLDSIKESTINYFSEKTKIIKLKGQNDTDVEKSLKYLIRKNFDDVILLGSTGDRLDHSICNLGIVLKFRDKINISILHEKSFLKSYTGDVVLNTIKNETISLYGFNRITKISSKGLKYTLKNISLPFGEKESSSNVATKDKVILKIKGGIIFIIRDLKLLIKHDLI